MNDEGLTTVSVAFYRQSPDDERVNRAEVINRSLNPLKWIVDMLVSTFKGHFEYHHCEIAFHGDLIAIDSNSPSLFAYGVFRKAVAEELGPNGQTIRTEMGGEVFGKNRVFSNPAYEWIHLRIPISKARNIMHFCEQQIGKPYDENGVKWCMVWSRKNDHKRWYCINLTVAALQQGGILRGWNPSALSVDDVHRLIQNHPSKINMDTPYEKSQLLLNANKKVRFEQNTQYSKIFVQKLGTRSN